MAKLTRIPLDIVVVETGQHTSGKIVAVMADDLDALEAENDRLRETLDFLHNWNKTCTELQNSDAHQ